ncbi:MAG TPA: hypothetical protein VFS67_29750 [Polyangiaceae bacterium]|nr:hypothetical protein [Polyangiaceae bacterium]
MPNLTGFTPQSNPEWITLQFDDGSESHPIHDPTEQYRQEVGAIASRVMGAPPPNPMAGALAQNDLGVTSVGPVNATDALPPPAVASTPAAPAPAPASDLGGISLVGPAARPGQTLADAAPAAPHAPGPVVGDPTRAIGSALVTQGAPAAFAPPAPPSRVKPAPAPSESSGASPRPDPYAPRYLQMGGTVGPSVTRSEQRTTEGLTDADKKRVDAANAKASEQAALANQEEYVAKANQFFSDWQRLGETAKQQLAEKNAAQEQERQFTQRVEAQRQKNQEIARRPIDPSEAFAGDAGAFAFMAAFGDALQNFGSALAGRGPVADPSARIESIINRSVQLQTQQKQRELEEGRITADQLEADREHVRFKLATAAKQLIETEEARAHTADEYKALGAFKQRMNALQADADAKNALATARKESVGFSRSITPGAQVQGGVDYFLGEDQAKNGGWKAVEGYTQRQAGGDQIENAVARFSRATGYNWDPQALGGQGAFRDKNGKVVTADHADVPGTTALGSNLGFLSGEMGREVQGALGDLAAGRAKIADPVGAVSDKSIEAQREQMAAGTDEGAFRAMESAARQLRTMRAKVDASVSPGVANAARLRRQEEQGFQATRPGLPASRPATPEELRRTGNAPRPAEPALPAAPSPSLGQHYSYSSTAPSAASKGRRH